MSEVVTEQNQAQSSSKKDLVASALARGLSPADAAKAAGCHIGYAHVIAREQKASTLDVETPDDSENRKDSPFPSRHAIAEHIWPCAMERAGGRYKIGDERFANAARAALEAADCFRSTARGRWTELVRWAVIIWRPVWRDYAARGRVIRNVAVSAESAAMAMSAAQKYLEHA